MIKVVHISTHSTGGAGRAAYRLHKGLLRNPNIQSTFISSGNHKVIYEESHIPVFPKEIQLHHKILNRFGVRKLNFYKNSNLVKNLKGNPEFFSMPETDYSLETLNIIHQSDIINLHWVANFINYPTFFKVFKDKPIVWTLHDMNPFQGGFHYSYDNFKNTSYNNLDSAFLQIKKRNIQLANNLTIVAPSQWLLKEAIRSNVFRKLTNYKRIQYGLDVQKFIPHDKNIAREQLGLSKSVPCIMIIAEDLQNHRKGLDLFCKAVEMIRNSQFQLLSIGSNRLTIKGNFQIKELGCIQNDEILSLAYSASDIVVLPSREDNLPNVMLEAFACGTPILSFKVGGMMDCIIPGFNGLLAETIHESALQTKLEEFLTNPTQFNGTKIREFALSNFSLELQANRYLSLYNHLIK